MFAIIAAKDVREVIRDGRLLWAGGLVVLLMLVSIGRWLESPGPGE